MVPIAHFTARVPVTARIRERTRAVHAMFDRVNDEGFEVLCWGLFEDSEHAFFWATVRAVGPTELAQDWFDRRLDCPAAPGKRHSRCDVFGEPECAHCGRPWSEVAWTEGREMLGRRGCGHQS